MTISPINFIKTSLILGSVLFCSIVLQSNFSSAQAKINQRYITRGGALTLIVQSFNLEQENSEFINSCLQNADECFFDFSARSSFDNISFNPLQLYPDVASTYGHAKAIHIASMLGLVHGYAEPSSPFYPERNLSRIHALKIVLGAAELLPWKEKFELNEQEKELLANLQINSPPDQPFVEWKWWYPRYLDFAKKNKIINEDFPADEPVLMHELYEIIRKTLVFLDAKKTGHS